MAKGGSSIPAASRYGNDPFWGLSQRQCPPHLFADPIVPNAVAIAVAEPEPLHIPLPASCVSAEKCGPTP